MDDDERFVPTARFKRVRREVKPRSDERFARLFDHERARPKIAPQIDPFGRPIGDVPIDSISSSDDEFGSEVVSDVSDAASEAVCEAENVEYGDISSRLAVVGCDWDNISAADLFVLFETMYRSLTSNHNGCVTRAAIYLSDFGKERLEAENVHGPILSLSHEVREEELDESERTEALRKYQKDRSRYYYGIVEFATAEQAKLLYDEMDGVEAYFAFAGLDLRFVPPEVSFDRDPTSECRDIPNNYEPPIASESAFRHSRVECKWDMPSMKRFKTLTKRFKEQDIESLDFKEYIASEDDEVDVEKYRSIVREKVECQDPVKVTDGIVSAKVGNYTISFGTDRDIPTLESPVLASDGRTKERSLSRCVRRKHKHTGGSEEAEAEDVRDFDARLSRIQQPGFEGDFDDSRFKRVFQDPNFAIDTRHPKYRNTDFNKKLLKKKAQLK